MDKQSLREWVAEENLHYLELCKKRDDYSPSMVEPELTDSILSHLKDEIEKVENPYTVFDAQMCFKFELLHLGMKHQGFEIARQAILKLFDEGK